MTMLDIDFSHALDDIYHSNSMHEMKVKADLHSVDLLDYDVLAFLIDTTTYHHAFWPHTAKRFTAFKQLLRTCKDLPKSFNFDKLKMHVESKMHPYDNGNFINSTPGRIQEVKNLKQVMKILRKLEEDYA